MSEQLSYIVLLPSIPKDPIATMSETNLVLGFCKPPMDQALDSGENDGLTMMISIVLAIVLVASGVIFGGKLS